MDMRTKIILFPFVFAIVWVLVLGLISVIGGWAGISRKHPFYNSNNKIIKLFKFQSLKISTFGRYSFCIHVTIFDNGILLQPSLFFKMFHNPIFIEYKQFAKPKIFKFLFINYLIFQIDDRRIQITGKSVIEIKNKTNFS